MKRLFSWAVIAGFFGKYVLSRCRLVSPPLVDDIIEHVTIAIGPIVGVPKHFHLIGAEHVPIDGPLIVSSNHRKLDDPLLVYHAGRMAAGGDLHLRIMMRDDYFVGPLWENPIIQAVSLFKCLGAYPINRDKPSLAQMKEFVQILEDGGGFVIFPGRTRTRSGMFIEYRDEFTEPGGVSWFIRQAQRRRSDVDVAALPVVRNFNPVSERTALIFGAPLYLDRTADKEALREFDRRVVYAMADLVELSAGHVISALLYFHALHGRRPDIPALAIEDAVRSVLMQTRHAHLDPDAVESPVTAVAETLDYLAEHGMLHRAEDEVTLDVAAILSVPTLDTKYRKKNPVKFLANQILHLEEVTALVEGVDLFGDAAAAHPQVVSGRVEPG